MVVSVLVLSLMPLSVDLSEDGDKVSHFIAYGSLMFWFGMVFPRRQNQVVSALGFVAMGIAVEYLQRMTGYRSFDVADMAANAVGVAAGWVLVRSPIRRLLPWIDRILQRQAGILARRK